MMKENKEERVVSLRSDSNTRAVIDYLTGSSAGHPSETSVTNLLNFAPGTHIVGRVKEDIIPSST